MKSLALLALSSCWTPSLPQVIPVSEERAVIAFLQLLAVLQLAQPSMLLAFPAASHLTCPKQGAVWSWDWLFCPQSAPADVLPAHWLLLVSIACALKHLTVLIMKPFSTLFAVGCRKHSCFRFTGNTHASMRTHSNPENTEEWHHILCNHQLRTDAEANDAGSAVAEKSPEWLLICFLLSYFTYLFK